MKRQFSFLLALVLLLTLSAPALALQETKEIVLTYCGISITLDGSDLIPADANGSAVEPFIFDGTIYLPVRGIASALGLSVSWDNLTSTIGLSSGGTASAASDAKATYALVPAQEVYRDISIMLNGARLEPMDASGNAVEPFLINGTTYLPLRAISEALGLTVSWDSAASTAVLSRTAQTNRSDSIDVKTTGTYVGSLESDK